MMQEPVMQTCSSACVPSEPSLGLRATRGTDANRAPGKSERLAKAVATRSQACAPHSADQLKQSDVALAGRAAAIAINGHGLALAFTVGAAILAVFVCRTGAACMSAFGSFFVSHEFFSLKV